MFFISAEAAVPDIPTDTTVGQITLIVVSVAAVITAVRPLIKSPKKFIQKRSYKSLAQELELVRRENKVLLVTHKSLSEWQFTARELIRLLRNSLADAGIRYTEQMQKTQNLLDKLDERINTSYYYEEEKENE